MPTDNPEKKTESPPKKSGEKNAEEPRPVKEPITPKRKGEVPPDQAEPIERSPGIAESE